MTTDYIKREDAKDTIEAIDRILNYCEEIDMHLPKEEQSGYDMFNDYLAVRRYLVNSVEIVRCKNCKHIKEEHFNIMPDGYSCELSGVMVEPEHYCSYGERAEA